MELHRHSNHDDVVRITDVTMRYDSRLALDNVSLTVRKGDFAAITGPNGGGKTTLLRIILGLLKPTKGSVWHAQKLRIGYLPQKNSIDSHFPVTISDVIKSGLLNSKNMTGTQKEQRFKDVLHQVGLQDIKDQPIGMLSGGQLQRALLGRAIISEPNLIVMDEPLSYIDKQFENELYGLLHNIAKHATIILVSHEMTQIAAMANRHFIVNRNIHECTAVHHTIHTDCC